MSFFYNQTGWYTIICDVCEMDIKTYHPVLWKAEELARTQGWEMRIEKGMAGNYCPWCKGKKKLDGRGGE
jgi:hypothetical protein